MMILGGRSMMTTTLARHLHIVSQNQPRNALVTQDAVAVPDQVDSHTPALLAHATPAVVSVVALMMMIRCLMAALVIPPPSVRPAPAEATIAVGAKEKQLVAQTAILMGIVRVAPLATQKSTTNADPLRQAATVHLIVFQTRLLTQTTVAGAHVPRKGTMVAGTVLQDNHRIQPTMVDTIASAPVRVVILKRRSQTEASVRPPPNVRPAPAEAAIAVGAKEKQLVAQTAILMGSVQVAPLATQESATHASVSPQPRPLRRYQRSRTEAHARPPLSARPAFAAAATVVGGKVRARVAPIAILTVIVRRVPLDSLNQTTNVFLPPRPRPPLSRQRSLMEAHARPALSARPAPAVVRIVAGQKAKAKAARTATRMVTVRSVPTASQSQAMNAFRPQPPRPQPPRPQPPRP